MNKFYRVIFDDRTGICVVAPESAAANRRSGRGNAIRAVASTVIVLVASLLVGPVRAELAVSGTFGAASYDSDATNYDEYLYRFGAYTPGTSWDSNTSLGFSMAIGDYARAQVNRSDDAIFGLDGAASSGRGGATAIGSMSLAGGETATAFGAWAQATRAFSLAMGGNSTASGIGAMAFGREALASGHYSIGEGFLATATGVGAIGVGASANASGARSIAVGTSSGLTAGNTNADASYRGTTAARAAGADSIGIGTNAAAGVDNGIALGRDANASAGNSVALGAGSTTTATLNASGYNPGAGTLAGIASALNGEVSLGSSNAERRLTNLAAGSAGTDAVNVSQLQSATGKVDAMGDDVAVALGGGSTYNATTGAVSAPRYTVAGGTQSDVGTALGALDSATVQFNGTDGAANVKGQKIENMDAGAVSAGSTDGVNGSQLYGASNSMASALGGGSVVKPDGSISPPTYAVNGSTVDNVGDALSNIDTRTTQNSTDIADLTAGIDGGSIGLVQQNTTTKNINVARNTDGTVVDVTGTAGQRTITGVAAGAVNARSFDAINGAQLYGANRAVASALGGGSFVTADGSLTPPAYSVGGSSFNNVGDALGNIDTRTTQNASDIDSITNTLNNISSHGDGIKYFHTSSTLADSVASGADAVAIGGNAQASAANSVALGSGSVADRANAVSVGAAGAERQITNVAAGTADTDAVNVAQLKATGLVGPDGNTYAAVTYDRNDDGSTNYNSVSLGNGVLGGTVIHNIAAGTADTDAVNVGQINAIVTQVSNIAANGNPMFAANGNRDTDAAIAGGIRATAIGANAVAAANNSVAIGADSVANRENTVSVGAARNERQITNVAAGTEGTDAVNVSQLNTAITQSASQTNTYTDTRFNSMQNNINEVAKNSYAGIAAAMAMPNLTPAAPGKTIVAAGAAAYKNGSAIGAGATYRSASGRWLTNGAVSVTNSGDAGVRAQVGYEF